MRGRLKIRCAPEADTERVNGADEPGSPLLGNPFRVTPTKYVAPGLGYANATVLF